MKREAYSVPLVSSHQYLPPKQTSDSVPMPCALVAQGGNPSQGLPTRSPPPDPALQKAWAFTGCGGGCCGTGVARTSR